MIDYFILWAGSPRIAIYILYFVMEIVICVGLIVVIATLLWDSYVRRRENRTKIQAPRGIPR